MSLLNAQRIGHLSIAILFLSGLTSMGHLTWSELVRLIVIIAGSVAAYVRYRDRLEEPAYRRPAAAILAILCAFALTQFDPETSIAGRYDQSPPEWARQAAYLLISLVPLLAVVVGPDRSTLHPSAWRREDRVVLGVIGGVIGISALASVFITERIEGDVILGVIRMFCYAALWLGVTRLYGSVSWAPESSGPVGLLVNRWTGVLTLALVLFIPTLVFGGIRTGQVFYHFREGQRAYGLGNFTEARERYEEADRWNNTLRLSSIHDGYLTDLAILNLRENRENAEETIERIRKNTPDPFKSDRMIAEIYLKAERWQQASELLFKILDDVGRDPSFIDHLGTAYLKTGDASGFLALADRFEYVPQVNPETFDEVMFLGNMHFYRGTYGEALTQFQRALELRPRDSYTIYKVGRALSAQKNCRAAIEQYEQALAVDPTFADAVYRIGECLESLGDTVGALARYRRAAELVPNHLDAVLGLRRLNG